MNNPRGPAIVEVWAPWCRECKAMQPAVDAVADQFAGRVDLVMINAEDDLDTVRSLGVKSTPTVIGYRDGREMFRYTGRRSRSELERLFSSVAEGSMPTRVGMHDLVLRVAAGLAMVAAGIVSGPSIPLIVIGAVLAIFGLATKLVRR